MSGASVIVKLPEESNLVSNENTIIIFDTIRFEYFKKIFEKIEIIQTNDDTVHKSKRVACKNFL